MSKLNLAPPFSRPMKCDVCGMEEARPGPARAGWRAVDAIAIPAGGGQKLIGRAYACLKCSPDLHGEPGLWDVFYANLLIVCYEKIRGGGVKEPTITKVKIWKAASNGFAVPVPVRTADDGSLEFKRGV